MKTVNITALILIIVGAINWGLVGLFEFNLVEAIFGTVFTGPMNETADSSVWSRIIYVLVGLAGLWGFYLLKPLSSHPDYRRTDTTRTDTTTRTR